MIILAGEYVERLICEDRTSDVTFLEKDQGDAYTALNDGNDCSGVSCPGTLHVSQRMQEVDVSTIGKPGDRVRVIVSPDDVQGGAHKSGSSRSAGVPARGYVLRNGRWEDAPVQIVPVRDELYSRTRGLLETDVLSDSSVFIVGLGSGGSYITWELAKLGIMNFTLMDHDRLEVANVVRHMAGVSDVGRRKTKVMTDMIHDKNPYANVRTHETKVSWDNIDALREIIRASDLVIVALDNREGRVIMNKVCVEENTPCVFAGAFQRAHGGQVLRVRPGESPCYQCFLEALPRQAGDQEVSNPQQAQRLAYSDRPVAVEAGLSTDIAAISLMVVKLAIQQLLAGKPTTLRSLDEDLVAPWYFWLNRREAGTEYEDLQPLEFNIDGMTVLRWYGISLDRNPACPCCGDFVGRVAVEQGVEVSSDEAAFFGEPETAS